MSTLSSWISSIVYFDNIETDEQPADEPNSFGSSKVSSPV